MLYMDKHGNVYRGLLNLILGKSSPFLTSEYGWCMNKHVFTFSEAKRTKMETFGKYLTVGFADGIAANKGEK